MTDKELERYEAWLIYGDPCEEPRKRREPDFDDLDEDDYE